MAAKRTAKRPAAKTPARRRKPAARRARAAGADALPADIRRLVDGFYVRFFGEMPLFPQERLKMGVRTSPDFTRLIEKVRENVLHGGALDEKTAQLMAVGHLAARASAGTFWHAKAARALGATWEELHKTIEISAYFNGIPALNEGGQALVRLYKEEEEERRGTAPKDRGPRN